MKVKVECTCGTRFEFEVEPVHGRMPVPINCPTCGVEATELANAVIRQQSALPQPAVTSSVAPTPPPPPPPASPPPAVAAPQSGLRISRSAHAPAVTAAAPSQTPQPPPASAPVEEG